MGLRRYRFLAFVLGLGGCAPSGPPREIDGPEATDLASRAAGVLLLSEPPGGIGAVKLATSQHTTVRPAATPDDNGEFATPHALSGPDSEGRVVVIDNHMVASWHELKVIALDGRELRSLFKREGDALWHHYIGESLALSSTSGKVACLSKIVDPSEPNPFVEPCGFALEVWNIGSGEGRKTSVVAQDAGLAWLPEDDRLLYVASVPRQGSPALPMPTDGFGEEYAERPNVPVVHILDAATGQSRRVHIGVCPRPTPDGRSMLVTDASCRTRLVDLATGASHPVKLPGQWDGAVAVLSGGVVLYRGVPTRHATGGYATGEGRSTLGRVLTVKAADLSTGEFQTVVSGVGPFTAFSFGCPATPP